MALMLKAMALSFLLAIPGIACATAQASDRISIDGEDYSLNTNPLSGHLEAQKWTPPKEAVISSANWRGYIAHWEIKGDQFVLTDVTIRVEGENRGELVKRSILRDLFPSASPVVADWYSGALIVPQGDITQYVHMGYGSSYESYQVFRITSGKVTEHLSLSGAEFEVYKAKKFDAFAKTDEFKKAYQDLRKDAGSMTEEQMRNFMKSFFAERYLAL